MEFEGIIKFIGPEETVGQKGLRKTSFVLEENSDKEFKSSIVVDLFGEKADLIKSYKNGDLIKVLLNSRAREYNGKWFNSITAWKIEGQGSSGSSKDTNDDLPF